MMHRNLLLSLLLTGTISACGAQKHSSAAASAVSISDSKVRSVSQAVTNRDQSQLFNFAHVAAVEPVLAKLAPFVGPGEAYLFFGDKNMFRVETNLTVDANGGLSATGSRYVTSQYYLDGYIFGRQLTDGSLIDMQAKADFNSSKLSGYVRFLGDDKYNGEIKVGIDKTFIRDLSYDKVVYGMPMLGVKVNATLGGELGMRAAPGLRADNALSASFQPKVKLNGSSTINLDALSFLSAEAKGSVEILDLKLSSASAMGLLPSTGFVYGSMALDGANVSALDGKIDLYAEADISGKLPSGVNEILWGLIGVSGDSMQWHHTLWDPQPAYLTTVSRYGSSFFNFYKTPDAASCQAQQALVETELTKRLGLLQSESTDDEYLSLIVSSNVTGMQDVIDRFKTYCEDGGKTRNVSNKGSLTAIEEDASGAEELENPFWYE